MKTILLALMLVTGAAAAQDQYPSKPIRILVGYAAGGGNDIIVRVLQPEMQKGLGQPVIIENKPGAQSIVAAELATGVEPGEIAGASEPVEEEASAEPQPASEAEAAPEPEAEAGEGEEQQG